MTKIRFVSVLGLGGEKAPAPHYDLVRYTFEGKTAAETPLVQVALHELLGPIDTCIFIGTEEVKARWVTTGLLASYLPKAKFVTIPKGSTEEERWAIFKIAAQLFQPERLERVGDVEVAEAEAPELLAVDLTHGFRAQPLLVATALNFARSEWARREVARPPSVRVFYGAYERQPVAPIWDLSEITEAASWNAALDALMRYGRADDLERLTGAVTSEDVQRAQAEGINGKDLGQFKFAARLGQAARSFVDDLATARIHNLLTRSSRELLKAMDPASLAGLTMRLPVLKEPLAQLAERVRPLQADSVHSEDGIKAMTALVQVLGRLQRFAEQAAVLREALVTQFGLHTGRLGIPDPSEKGCQAAREGLEVSWGRLFSELKDKSKPPTQLSEALEHNRRLSSEVVQLRNDIEHGGLNDKPSSSQDLRKKLDGLADRMSNATAPQTFLNLSNHLLNSWAPEQLRAAQALRLGEPVDLEGGMPLVDSLVDGEEVRAQATALVKRVLDAKAAGAFVAGEFTLTVELVRQLQRCGVRCFTATTDRVAREVARPDGTVERVSEFRFVRWREYGAG